MPRNEAVENLRVRVSRQREEAEALARSALEKLARLASGITPLEQIDAGEVRAAAETFADQLARYRAMCRFAADLREILL